MLIENIVKYFLKKRNAENLYEDLMDLLLCNETLRTLIFYDVERDFHREDVREELLYRASECNCDEPQKEITDDDIEEITDLYEKYLRNDDSWHISLNLAIDKVLYGI